MYDFIIFSEKWANSEIEIVKWQPGNQLILEWFFQKGFLILETIYFIKFFEITSHFWDRNCKMGTLKSADLELTVPERILVLERIYFMKFFEIMSHFWDIFNLDPQQQEEEEEEQQQQQLFQVLDLLIAGKKGFSKVKY